MATSRIASRRPFVAVLAAVAAFAVSFVAARALAGDEQPDTAAPVSVPEQTVTINNLERSPTIKPLRHAAGAPPVTTAPAP
jgi:hypothetical protein